MWIITMENVCMVNRRGQIPIFMLIIVALVLVISALVSFNGFRGDFGDQSINVSKTLAGVDAAQNYVIKSAELIAADAIKTKSDIPEVKFMEIAASRDIGVQEAGNFFAKIRNNEFSFEREGDLYVLNVEKLFVQASYGNNAIKRNFDLNMKFNETGDGVGEIRFINEKSLGIA